MTRVICLLAIFLGLSLVAKADGVGWRFNDGINGDFSDGIMAGSTTHNPPSCNNGLLLEAGGLNCLLLEDGVSHLCLESGC